MAREQAAGIVARDEEEQHRIAVSVFEAAGAVIKLAPDLVGPAKAAIMMRKVFDEIKYLCQNDTSSNPTVRAIYTALTLVEEDIVCG